ncbi:MAG: hypothetical protein IJ815_05865 [Lachnospiraceae bacterium]|nr:hypothetical protein [Lachnospiraceae bacterium]
MSEEDIKIEETVGSEGTAESGEMPEDGKKEGTVTIKEEEVHLKTKTIPAVIMLLAGAVTAIAAFIRHYPVLLMLELTLGALVLFLVIGEIVKIILDRIVVIRRIEVVEEKSEDEAEEGSADLKDGDSRQEQAENNY